MPNNSAEKSHKNSFLALSSDGATLAKVIATICVVSLHSYKLFKYVNAQSQEIFYLRGIHAFDVCCLPIFFLLAGYYLTFKDDWDYVKNLRKKFRSLVIPYLGFISIYAVVSCVGSLALPAFFDDFRKFTANDWLMHLFGIPFLKDPTFYGPLWFVRELIIFNLLSFVLVPVVKRIPGYLLIPAMMAIYFMPINRKTCYAITFFVMGLYFGLKKMIPIIKNAILIMVVSVAGFMIPVVFEGDLANEISILLLSISILSAAEKLIRNDKIKRMAQIAIPFSFPVYLLHEYLMTTITRLLALQHVSMPGAIAIFLVLPIPIIFLCICVAVLWKRISPKTYVMLIGGRY